MNRREAIAALVSLPAVARIAVAQLKPADVLIVECDDYLSEDAHARIRAVVGDLWPGHKVAIFDKGVRLRVLEG